MNDSLHNNSVKNVSRESLLKKLQEDHFDLTIIGGGITGAGIALDAVTRGLKVALLDKRDFASGTSSRSTKLIHGGLRYLKNFEFKLVRDVGKERTIVYRNAPHLVSKEKMLLPLVKGGTYKRLSISFALWLYDLLAGVKSEEKRIMLNKRKTLVFEKLLNSEGLKGSGFYTEYRTDDARLTIEIIKTAVALGAVCVNYCKCTDLKLNDSDNFTKVKEKFTGEEFFIQSKKIVNAAGPWVDKIRSIDEPVTGKRIFHSKGVHIVVPRKKLNVSNPIYFDVDDGRMIFVIPREKATYIGTTDTPYENELDEPGVTTNDVKYLVSGVNTMFPTNPIKVEDVISSWSGLRPLIYEDGKSPSEMSRKDEVFVSKSGLITIAGGKFTGYRLMAKKVVNLVCKKLRMKKSCVSDKIPLTKPSFKSLSEVQEFKTSLIAEYKPKGIKLGEIDFLVSAFGPNARNILTDWDQSPKTTLLNSVAAYCIKEEYVQTLSDFYIRRTGYLYFSPQKIKSSLLEIAKLFAEELGWSDERTNLEIKKIQNHLTDITNFN